MTISHINKIKSLYKKQMKITERINGAAYAAFPVGSIVYFEKGNAHIEAEIIGFCRNYTTGHLPWFKIRNINTSKEYFVGLYWFIK